ncbi:MAG: hypothetical protein K2P93_06000 [Alphaproteobacteria bacterium]|nr:hypothetical protein [Alphaproteobacteria bacterium]
MRLLYFFLALFLITVSAYGMEENEDENSKVMRHARHAVRPVILTTLEKYFESPQNLTQELRMNWSLFKLNFYSIDFINTLNRDIMQFLKDGTDPSYLGCAHSFRDAAEALKSARVTFDHQTNTIKILTDHEAEIRDLMDDFVSL